MVVSQAISVENECFEKLKVVNYAFEKNLEIVNAFLVLDLAYQVIRQIQVAHALALEEKVG